SPYDFYQYWRNVEDADVVRCIKMLTFIPLEEIAKMEKWQGAELNRAKEILAFEVTKMVHGEEEAKKAEAAAKALFGGGAAAEIPTVVLSKELFADGKIGLLDIMVAAGAAPSKGEARRLVMQGGVNVNGVKVTDAAVRYEEKDFADFVLGKGKKTFIKITL
ncbi:MAG: tyrosine--tRNA ligase, partial [Clostridia bacterium]|nr:tyrosine--tRNA ligase [Clostridia bacterium]